MTRWLIVGASGHGKSLAAIIRGRGEDVAALSDSRFGDLSTGAGPDLAPFCGDSGSTPRCFGKDLDAFAFAAEHALSIAIGVGDNALRLRIAAGILAEPRLAVRTDPLVARTATVDRTAALGPLSQICEHAHVGPLATVGYGAIVNTSAVVEHDSVVGNGAHIAPGAVLLGATEVGEQVFVGSGARLLPGVVVGDFAVLGAGAVATRPLAGMATYVGVPAQPLVSKKGPAH
jgi:sugar O-acyltransferase (sialic acid O-acetyltransferase NeuD family)